MVSAVQRSFAGGEIAPAMYGRVDQTKYQTGLKTLYNFFVQRYGGVSNRAGTTFIAEVKDSSKRVREIPFIFNDDQTYVLEFGDQYMRVHRQGVQLTESAVVISAATQANPVVITAVTHGYTDGDEVVLADINGMTELNGRNFKINNSTTNTFELQDMDGVDLDGTGYTAYTSGGNSYKVYEISTPYLEADLQELDFAQSGDVVTITHTNYLQRDLSRTGHTSWTLSALTFTPSIPQPDSGSGSPGSAGTGTYRYRVTAVKEETFEESLPGFETAKSVSGATQANPCVVTVTSHGYSNGDEVYLDLVEGMTELNGARYTIANKTANTFELSGIDSTSYTAYTTGGTCERTSIVVDSAATPSSSAPITLSWSAVDDALEYHVYKETNSVYGYIGIAGSTSFSDTNITPNTDFQPPIERNPFSASGDYPRTVTYYQQRRIYASTDNEPETVFTSRSANYQNFTYSSPQQDDDAITFTIAGNKINEIQHMVNIKRLLALTTSGVYTIAGDVDGILKPAQINPDRENNYGASSVRPAEVGSSIVYVQNRGSILRDLNYKLQSDGFDGRDLSIFANHLFTGYQITDMAYAEMPHSIIWCVRDDGKILSLTYVPDHEVWGFGVHETDGIIENVVTVPEGDEDAVYVVVKRTINGSTRRYIEQFHTRRVTDVTIDAYFVDCGLSYDGRNTDDTLTMTLSGGTLWEYTETLTLTASSAYFSATEVGNAIVLQTLDEDGNITDSVTCTITAYTSTTVVSVNSNKTVPAAFQSVAISDWSRAVDTLTNFWHLEGEELTFLADGNVLPNATVVNGSVTLDRPYSIIHGGLGYYSDFETLDIDSPDSETLSDKKLLINGITLMVESSRGIFAGYDENNLLEYPQRTDEAMGEATRLKTGKVELPITGAWGEQGRFLVRQSDPLPLNILTVVPNIDIGG